MSVALSSLPGKGNGSLAFIPLPEAQRALLPAHTGAKPSVLTSTLRLPPLSCVGRACWSPARGAQALSLSQRPQVSIPGQTAPLPLPRVSCSLILSRGKGWGCPLTSGCSDHCWSIMASQKAGRRGGAWGFSRWLESCEEKEGEGPAPSGPSVLREASFLRFQTLELLLP